MNVQHKPYVLLQQTSGSCTLCCSHTLHDRENIVCFSFKLNTQQVYFEITNAANEDLRAPHAFSSTFHLALKVFLYNLIIIIEIDFLYACDTMYKFL